MTVMQTESLDKLVKQSCYIVIVLVNEDINLGIKLNVDEQNLVTKRETKKKKRESHAMMKNPDMYTNTHTHLQAAQTKPYAQTHYAHTCW